MKHVAIAGLILGMMWTTAGCGGDDCTQTSTCERSSDGAGPSAGGTGGAPITGGGGTGAQGGAGAATGAGGFGGAGGAGGGGTPPLPGEVIWEAGFGDVAADNPTDLGVLSDGSVAIAGHFEGSLTFGGEALVSGGGKDVFVTTIDSSGAERWARQFGGASNQQANKIAVDSGDNVFVVGSFSDSINFDGLSFSAAVVDVFLAKLSASGQALWAEQLTGSLASSTGPAATTPGNDVVVLGSFHTSASFDNLTIPTPPQGTFAAFLAHVNGINGNAEWAETTTTPFNVSISANAVSVDNAGNVAFAVSAGTQMAGSVSVTYDGVQHPFAGNGGTALFRTDSTGNYVWHKGEIPGVKSLSTFPNGDVLVCGGYSGDGSQYGDLTLPSALGGSDVWVARFASTGGLVWSRQFGGAGNDGAWVSCAAAGADAYVLAARTDGEFGIGVTQLPSIGDSVIVAKIDGDDNVSWTRQSMGAGRIVRVDSNANRAALLVDVDDAIGFDSSYQTSGAADVYVAVFAL